MKFAVVEYSSKTGRIWRHTPERPNYLCNPDTEMDPTSFGCYVSALSGEHIPLTGLIIGEEAGIFAPLRAWRKVRKRVTGHWPLFSIDYLQRFTVVMVVHQISDGHEVTAFTKRLKKAYPHLFIIGVPTQPYGILRRYWETHPEFLSDLQEFMNACDLYITIVESTKDAWQKLTHTRVEYLAQPYPVEYAQAAWLPLSAKKPVIFVAGVPDRPDIPKGYEVASRLRSIFPDYLFQVTSSGIVQPGFTAVPFRPWREQLDYLASVKLVINTDYTQTRGRVQMDCAAAGTPSLGSDSDAQRDLWPQLAARQETSVDALVDVAGRLLTDAAWYQSQVTHAQGQLPKYNYTASAQRLKEMVRAGLL